MKAEQGDRMAITVLLRLVTKGLCKKMANSAWLVLHSLHIRNGQKR